MAKETIEAIPSLQFADLKEIALVEGPCLTITIPISSAPNVSEQQYRRLRAATQAAEPLLTKRGFNAQQIREFLDPVRQIEGNSWGTVNGGLVVLRSPDHLRYFQVRHPVPESVTVASHFDVVPYLRPLQEEEQHFYILALSQKHVRLLRCTNHSSEEVPLPPKTPTNIEDWLNTRTPTRAPERDNSRPREAGSTEGGFTSTHDRDRLDPHITNFFHQVDAAVVEVLRGETSPLVLAGVEFEVSMYRALTSYQHLTADYVEGSPDSLKGGAMHARALEVAKVAFEEPMKKALEQYERVAGTDRIALTPEYVMKAAVEGRVAHLFVQEGARYLGRWDDQNFRAVIDPEGEDLVNMAALQTIAHAGEVWVTSQENVPSGGAVAALLRY